MNTTELFKTSIEMIGIFVIVIGLFIAMFNLVQLMVSAWNFVTAQPTSDARTNWNNFAKFAPSVTILVPAFNEGSTICTSVGALLSIEYPNFEVIVINDGSDDETLSVLKNEFGLVTCRIPEIGQLKCQNIVGAYKSTNFPRLLVLDKKNGGKADALNAGANSAQCEYICVIDADSILARDALLVACRAFINSPEKIVAIGGAIRLANGCHIVKNDILRIGLPKSVLSLFQTIEYMRTFHVARNAMSNVGALTLISGAFGLFSKDLIYEVGGYSHDTVGEDYELCVRIQKHFCEVKSDARMIFCPDAICWTQAPETLSVLGRQRSRWQRGALETLWKHKGMIFNFKYGRPATIALLEAFLCDVLAPLCEFLGYLIIPIAVLFGLLSVDYLIGFLSLSIGFGIAQSAGAIILEEMRFRQFPRIWHILILLFAGIMENFGYRQLCGFWRIIGFVEFLLGKKSWGEMTRQKFSNSV